jgi:hypothetical protein
MPRLFAAAGASPGSISVRSPTGPFPPQFRSRSSRLSVRLRPSLRLGCVTTELWLSTDAKPDRTTLGEQWQQVGTVDLSPETDLARVVQAHLGQAASTRVRVAGFFGDINTECDWYRQLVAQHPEIGRGERLVGDKVTFWLALRLVQPTVLFSCELARLAYLPNPHGHPASIDRGVSLGFQLRAGEDGFFVRVGCE